MKYKGYTGVVEFDEESGSLYGRVIGLRDVITFQGESVAEVTQAFHDSVDDYLEFCAERGRTPDKPYSGQFVLRIDPGLHRALSHAAEEKGQSLTSLVEETLAARFLGPAFAQGHEVTMGQSARPPARPRRSSGGVVVRPARKRAKGA
jgi:predicted HicB family RNase H-like nuclease